MNKQIVEGYIGSDLVSIETGVMAKQANGSCVVRCGDCVILATATMSKEPKPGIDFFPLTVEYAEKMYAGGKIPGGFFKRETRPSTSATLISRLIDRPIRPCFPSGFHNDVQVVVTVLSHDKTLNPEWLYILAASAALTVSDIPFKGPIAAANVNIEGDSLWVNPKVSQEDQKLEMVLAGTEDAVLMIESAANEVTEAQIIDAIQEGHKTIQALVSLQKELQEKCQVVKQDPNIPELDGSLLADIQSKMGSQIAETLQSGDKKTIETFLSQLESDVLAAYQDNEEQLQDAKKVFAKLKKAQIRESIIKSKVRPDGRQLDEIRPIFIETGLLPSVHGSSLFTRGETQSLGVVTLGTSQDEQLEEGLTETVKNQYYFHYNFPPYSVGEVGMMRTGRRELGHGALAQRALKAMLPAYEDFPYTIRIVSEILESNGSSSMASVCSGALALMDCGVPLKKPVSGIAMGLLLDEQGDYSILSDIQGLEDHYGDMDFKVAGTREGITALQLDIKVAGLTQEILQNALAQAKAGRLHILEEMNTALSEPRESVSKNAPKIHQMTINPEKVGALIGPGGKTIKKIEEDTGAVVFVVDGTTGSVSVSGPSSVEVDAAIQIVEMITKDLEKGQVLDAKVVKIVQFGAFVELAAGKEALLHISKIAKERVNNVEDYLKVGDVFPVKVSEVDKQGKVAVTKILD